MPTEFFAETRKRRLVSPDGTVTLCVVSALPVSATASCQVVPSAPRHSIR